MVLLNVDLNIRSDNLITVQLNQKIISLVLVIENYYNAEISNLLLLIIIIILEKDSEVNDEGCMSDYDNFVVIEVVEVVDNC